MAYGKYAVDYEQRINYDRLRKDRVDKVKAQMMKDNVGAILTFDADNNRNFISYYVTTPMRISVKDLCLINDSVKESRGMGLKAVAHTVLLMAEEIIGR